MLSLEWQRRTQASGPLKTEDEVAAKFRLQKGFPPSPFLPLQHKWVLCSVPYLRETNRERSWKHAIMLELIHPCEILPPVPWDMLRGQQSLFMFLLLFLFSSPGDCWASGYW